MNRTLKSVLVPVLAIAAGVGTLSLTGCYNRDPNNITFSDDFRQKGIVEYQAGRYENASGAFANAVRQNPRDWRSMYYLGVTYDVLGARQQSIQSYKNGVEVLNAVEGKNGFRAERNRLLDGLAIAIARSETWNTEVSLIERQARTRQEADDYFVLGKIFKHRQDPDSAIANFQRALLMDGSNYSLAKEYGLYLVQLNQPKQAETPLRRAYVLNPDDTDVATALRSIGIVPGPSLKDSGDLARPIIPRGPLPEVDVTNIGLDGAIAPK